MNPDFYKKLIQKSPVGYAYHKVLFDKNNKALDYIFLEVNSEFEELTGLKEEDIINKRITEITPDIREDKFDWINFYGEIALGGNEKEFIQYSRVFGKYYKILAYSPEEGHFVSLFSDLSNKIESQLQVKKVLESSEIFIKTDASKPNYQKILDLGLELSGAKFAMYNEFNEVDLDFTTVAFSGIGKSIKKVISILGFNPLGKHWKHDPVRASKIEKNRVTFFNSLSDLSGDVIPNYVMNSLEKFLDIKKSAIVKISNHEEILGDITLFFTKEHDAENKEIIEIFAGQVFMFLKRLKANKEIEDSETRLRMLLKNAGEGILGIDLNGNHTFVNPQATKFLGFTEEEMIGVNSHNLWHHHHEDGSEYPDTDCPIYETLNNGEEISKEGYFFHKDGHGIYVNYTCMPIRDNDKISGAVLTFVDITVRKLAEKQITLLATGLKSVSEGVSIADLNNNIIFVNDSFLKMYGYSENEVLGNKITMLRSEDNSPVILKEIEISTLKDGWLGEIINSRKDGSTFPILLSTSPIHNDKGNIIATVGVARDITEQKKAEQTIKDQNNELKDLVATRDKFFSIISHDLRSPFSSFLGLTEILAGDTTGIDEEQQKTILKSLNKSAINFSNLLENLLQWSSFQQGNIPFDPIILNLKYIVGESIETAYETATAKIK